MKLLCINIIEERINFQEEQINKAKTYLESKILAHNSIYGTNYSMDILCDFYFFRIFIRDISHDLDRTYISLEYLDDNPDIDPYIYIISSGEEFIVSVIPLFLPNEEVTVLTDYYIYSGA